MDIRIAVLTPAESIADSSEVKRVPILKSISRLSYQRAVHETGGNAAAADLVPIKDREISGLHP